MRVAQAPRTDGSTGGAFSGLGPNIQNWAVGMSVTFPAFDLAANRARRQIALHRELSEAAQYRRLVQDLKPSATGHRPN